MQTIQRRLRFSQAPLWRIWSENLSTCRVACSHWFSWTLPSLWSIMPRKHLTSRWEIEVVSFLLLQPPPAPTASTQCMPATATASWKVRYKEVEPMMSSSKHSVEAIKNLSGLEQISLDNSHAQIVWFNYTSPPKRSRRLGRRVEHRWTNHWTGRLWIQISKLSLGRRKEMLRSTYCLSKPGFFQFLWLVELGNNSFIINQTSCEFHKFMVAIP